MSKTAQLYVSDTANDLETQSDYKSNSSVQEADGARCWSCSWLRHCATSWKVAGSIADGVTGILDRHNPSGRTTALGLTQPLTEKSTRNIS